MMQPRTMQLLKLYSFVSILLLIMIFAYVILLLALVYNPDEIPITGQASCVRVMTEKDFRPKSWKASVKKMAKEIADLEEEEN